LWPDKQSTKSQEPSLRGKPTACYTWSLFLQASAGKNPARSLPGAQDTAVPAVGADSASHRSRASRPSPLLPFHAASHRLRRYPRISDVGTVLLFEGQCLFANTVVPRINVISRSLLWAVPAQAPEAVCPRTSSVSSAAPGSLRSPFRGAPEPAVPTLPDRLPAHAPLRSAPYGTARLVAVPHRPHRTDPAGYETGQHHRPTSISRPKVSADSSALPRPGGRKKV
jgi:hypothetical protein